MQQFGRIRHCPFSLHLLCSPHRRNCSQGQDISSTQRFFSTLGGPAEPPHNCFERWRRLVPCSSRLQRESASVQSARAARFGGPRERASSSESGFVSRSCGRIAVMIATRVSGVSNAPTGPQTLRWFAAHPRRVSSFANESRVHSYRSV